MTRRRTLLTAITAGTAGAAGCLGILGGGGTEETGDQKTIGDADDTRAPTATPTTAVSTQETLEPATDDGTDRGTGTAEPVVDFEVVVEDLSSCGRTCRTLTYTVQNVGHADADEVTVDVAVSSPDAGGETVYEGSQSVGALDGRSQREATTTISLDEAGAATIRDEGGSVAVEMTASDGAGTSETFTVERTIDVATATATVTSVEGVGFNLLLDEITKCGKTCRTMHYTVQNVGDADATGVEARIRVYTPDMDGEQVYEDTQELGDVSAQSELVDNEKDIDTGLVDGRTIQDNDGEIVIRVNLSADGGATGEFTFAETLDV